MMNKIAATGLVLLMVISVSWVNQMPTQYWGGEIDSLVQHYRQPVAKWPKPTIDSGVKWEEFSSLPKVDGDYFDLMESPEVVLGKYLFFDPILSGSNQISCSSCHNPQTSWADKNTVPIGNDHLEGTRNTPSLLNVYARKTLFWDGRSGSLEEQALGPIAAHHEMNMELNKLVPKLKAIPAYNKLFIAAFGDEDYAMPEIMKALAAFQRTLTSRRSRFDEFIEGNYNALNDQEIKGLHLFRTKARCMNCHNGKFFTDEAFHNIGLTYYKRKYEDLGRYLVTNDPADIGKFRTPSLRDVMNTDPWMHNGLFWNMTGLLNLYNSGMQMNSASPAQKAADPNYPVTDPLMKKLNLSKTEIQDIEAFLHSITATKYRMRRPDSLPR
ncbi:cytochrome-c peroxidase [Sphingobacterium deserti]|uniref:Methylamine utilization protein MauG n=1 Tax=Sphingobacterium deserti TaxID=1229276 RepID=A0A0B8SZ91_9SPHI|nr:cytochrome c peroxidase [Sphingobacterium deserti]KGE13012.1 methylamine utilization protein [Sphingobacterium deserti]